MTFPRFLTLAALVALAACNRAAPVQPDAAAQAAQIEKIAQSSAEFRALALQNYIALARESCKTARLPNPLLPRAKVLAVEIAAMRAFEVEVASKPAGVHLEIVRSDVEQMRSSGKLGCWADDYPPLARKHVEMARETATTTLAEMRKLAPGLDRFPGAGLMELARAAPFRALVRDFALSLDAPCPLTRAATNDQVMAPARNELALLRRRFGIGSYGVQLAIAAADGGYEADQIAVECVADPGNAPLETASRKPLEDARTRAAAIIASAR